MSRKLPGRSWRFQAFGVNGKARHPPIRLDSASYDGPTEFDELVVGDWLHLEQMHHRDWWCHFGPVSLNIKVRTDGTCDLIIEDDDGAVVGRWQAGKRVDLP